LTKTGKDAFSYEQGEVLFVENEKGEIEHIFMSLYAERRSFVYPRIKIT